jgi:hypothetical protein
LPAGVSDNSRLYGGEKDLSGQQEKSRTAVMDYDEVLLQPGMKAAMDLEIETFRKTDVFDKVKIDDLPDGTNKISTRCVLTT